MDDDGLLAAGEPGVQLTWMDARVGDRVITPRIGKPVEIQALWLNALWIAATIDAAVGEAFDRGRASSANASGTRTRRISLTWSTRSRRRPARRHDSAESDSRGRRTAAAAGRRRARAAIVDASKSAADAARSALARAGRAGYRVTIRRRPVARDAVYHQGTVWPWLMGPFVDAWVRVRGNTPAARQEARTRFVEPLLAHLESGGLGHVSEITDAEPPFTPRGCPFQAWSLGELLRLDRQVLVEPRKSRATPVTARAKRSIDAVEDRGVRGVGSI